MARKETTAPPSTKPGADGKGQEADQAAALAAAEEAARAASELAAAGGNGEGGEGSKGDGDGDGDGSDKAGDAPADGGDNTSENPNDDPTVIDGVVVHCARNLPVIAEFPVILVITNASPSRRDCPTIGLHMKPGEKRSFEFSERSYEVFGRYIKQIATLNGWKAGEGVLIEHGEEREDG